jgi:electron transfer flavoprotein beta subunit
MRSSSKHTPVPHHAQHYESKKKPVQVISLEDMVAELGLNLDDVLKPRNQVVEVYEPPPRKEGELVGSVDELVAKLKEKGLVGQ